MKTVDIAANRTRIKQLAGQSGPRSYPRLTMLTYGKSRSGKTELLATFPRPLILADNAESGWKTIESMDEEKFFEPNWVPKVIAIESMDDFMNVQPEIGKLVQQYGAQTIGVDSLTFLGDMLLDQMEKKGMGKTKDGNDDPRALYTRYKNFLRAFRLSLHALPVNIVWCCLEAGIDEKTKLSGPLMNGQSKDLFPAACDAYFYQTKIATAKGVRFFTHTTQYGPFPAGGRFGGKLPTVIEDLTYKKLVYYAYENGLQKDLASTVAVEDQPSETEAPGDTEEPGETETLPKGRAPVPAPPPRQTQRTPVAAVVKR